MDSAENKLDISLIQDKLKIKFAEHMQTPLLFFVLMMLNFMGIGGMKDQIGYMFCLRKFIMINVTLS